MAIMATATAKPKVEMGKRIPHEVSIHWKKLSPAELEKISFDKTYTRDLDSASVRSIMETIMRYHGKGDLAFRIEPISLYERNKALWCTNGKHRIEAAIKCGVGLCAVVINGLSRHDEIRSYSEKQKGRKENSSHDFDNMCIVDTTFSSTRDLFTQITPGWNYGHTYKIVKGSKQPKSTLSRNQWMQTINSIRMDQFLVHGKNVKRILESLTFDEKTYIKQVISLIKDVHNWDSKYGDNKLKDIIPFVWKSFYSLQAHVLVAVQFHKKYGNVPKTNNMIKKCFSIANIGEISYKNRIRNGKDRGQSCHFYEANFMLAEWNKKAKKNHNQKVPYISTGFLPLEMKNIPDTVEFNTLYHEECYMG